MARITVEDCIDKLPSRFELVLVASNRARKLHSGESPTVEKNNDKNTVIALREIADETISIEEMKKYCEDKKYDEIWIIGGESIYKQMLHDPDLQDIHVTKIDKLYKTDTYFPNIPPENFSLLSSSQMLSEGDIDYRHMIYRRINLNNVNKNDKLYTSFPRYGGMLPTLPTKWTVHL